MLISKDQGVLEDLLDPKIIQALKQLKTGGVLTERRLAKYLGISHVTTHSILVRLAALYPASSKQVGRANLWTLNTESYAYQAIEPLLKAIDRIEAPRAILKKVVLNLIPVKLIKIMTLFGSVTDGTEREGSDIDLCIVLAPKVRPDDPSLEKGLGMAVERCYQLFGKRLSPYVLTQAEWDRKKGSPLREQIEKGEKIFP